MGLCTYKEFEKMLLFNLWDDFGYPWVRILMLNVLSFDGKNCTWYMLNSHYALDAYDNVVFDGFLSNGKR